MVTRSLKKTMGASLEGSCPEVPRCPILISGDGSRGVGDRPPVQQNGRWYSVFTGDKKKKNTPKEKTIGVDSWMEISCAVCPGFALPGTRGRARGADDESCIQKNSRLRMGEFGRRGPETWAAFDIHSCP